MASYRSSGGVTRRKKTRMATTPDDPSPEKKKPLFSSSLDENRGSASCLAKDGVNANYGVKALNKSERKLLLKQLIEQETFSRVDSYELALLVDSKVADKPVELEERSATFPGKVTADVEAFEEKHIEKKKETSLVAKIYDETCDLNPSGTEHVLQLCIFLKDSKVGQIDVGSFTLKFPCHISSKPEELHSASCLAKDGVDANYGVKALNKSERKLLLKQLIEQETFSRVESYELALLVDSKVADKPIELEQRSATFPGKVTAVEALAKIYDETCDLNPPGTEHVLQLCLFLKDSKVGQIDVGGFTVKFPCHTSSKPEKLHSDSHGLPAKELAEFAENQK